MPDKDISQTIDDFFDIRALSAVIVGFTFTKWLEVIVQGYAEGNQMLTEASIWPIILVFFIVIMANAGKKTNHELKRYEFNERMKNIEQQMQTKDNLKDGLEDNE